MYVTMPVINDPFSKRGLDYFERIYGPCLFGNETRLVLENEDASPEEEPDICGWVRFHGLDLPVLFAPKPIAQEGEPICTYYSPDEQYHCIQRTKEGIRFSINVFRHIGFFLSGEMESIWKKDAARRRETVQYPFTDLYARAVFDAIRNMYLEAAIPFVSMALWPDGMSYAVCLTHDVDEIKKKYQWITHPLRCIQKRDIEGLSNQIASLRQKLSGSEPYWTFDDIIRIEREAGGCSSFYFLREDADFVVSDSTTWHHLNRKYDWNDEHVVEIIRKLKMEGWEVGLHGSFHSYDRADKLAEEKNSLEQVLGEPVRGGRQHNLNLLIPETWRIHESLDMMYDTTLGYNDCIEFRWGTCFPFSLYDRERKRVMELLEIPLIIEDLPFFREKDGWNQFVRINEQIENIGGVLTLLWHHSVLNATEFPVWTECYQRILAHCRARNAWITSAEKIAAWWVSRSRMQYRIVAADRDRMILSCEPDQSPSVHIDVPAGVHLAMIENAEIIHSSPNRQTIRLNSMKDGKDVILTFQEDLN